MSWITLAESHFKTAGLTAPELNAARTVALPSGATDTLADVIDRVTNEVRGRVAACSTNQLGDGATIPDECLTAALARGIFELCVRIPRAIVLTDERKESNRNAIDFLKDVAACRVALVQPETVSADVVAGPAVTLVASRTRVAKTSHLSGL